MGAEISQRDRHQVDRADERRPDAAVGHAARWAGRVRKSQREQRPGLRRRGSRRSAAAARSSPAAMAEEATWRWIPGAACGGRRASRRSGRRSSCEHRGCAGMSVISSGLLSRSDRRSRLTTKVMMKSRTPDEEQHAVVIGAIGRFAQFRGDVGGQRADGSKTLCGMWTA